MLDKDLIINLLSSSIDINKMEDMVSPITRYLKKFTEIDKICFLSLVGEESQVLGDIFEKKHLTSLPASKDIPRQYIGTLFPLATKPIVKAVPLNIDNENIEWLLVKMKTDISKDVFNAYFFQYLNNIKLVRSHAQKVKNLTVLATTDDVTGLFNQRKLAEDLENAINWHQKEHEKFSIMFIDVDHFKNVNDDYGHLVGSKLLLDLGKALKLILRQTDHIYRYGGDEFVVIMPNIETSVVHEVAVRILGQLKEYIFDIENGDKYQMSLSIGIAEYPTDAKSAMDIIRFADQMMYKSKKSGRGKVFHVNEVADVDVDTE